MDMDNCFVKCVCNNGTISPEPKVESCLGVEKCLSEYIDGLKKYIETWTFAYALKDCNFSFYLVFHGAEDLYNSGNYHFRQELLTEKEKLPCIHLSLYDVFNHEEKLLSTKRYHKIIDSSIWNYYVPLDNEKKNEKGETEWEYSDNYELFVKALEEIARNTHEGLYNLSIAHEYADLHARLVEQSHLTGSHDAISPFLFHSENEMRKKIDEYKNTQKDADDNENRKGTNQTIWQYRWRILLLDDKSIKPLTNIEKKEPHINKAEIIINNLSQVLKFNKNKILVRKFDFDLLRENLKEHPVISNEKNKDSIIDSDGKKKDKIKIKVNDKEEIVEIEAKVELGKVKNGKFEPVADIPDDVQIVIDCVEKIEEAKYCLQTYKYEIVLLDYLLKDEYGYELLGKLQKWNQDKGKREKEDESDEKLDNIYKPGPNKRFFFMFISAFTTAVHERMLEQGFGRRERHLWIIGDGACPTNTPYLFSYQLMQLMCHRINDLRKGNEGGYLTLIELLNEIFVGKENKGPEDIRQKAHDNFNKLLFMRNKYRQLENDLSVNDEKNANSGNQIFNMKSSLLVQSVYKYVNHFSGAFFEHLQHLVYLVAYGTIRQWQDMWEEYVFINKELCNFDDLINKSVKNGVKERNYIRRIKRSKWNDNNKDKGEGQVVSDAIRDYIINLKENNY